MLLRAIAIIFFIALGLWGLDSYEKPESCQVLIESQDGEVVLGDKGFTWVSC